MPMINEAVFALMEGVAEALWRLSDEGVWIRIISHRLYVNWGHAVAAGDTAAWLDTARIPYRDLCFIGAKSAIDADAYVESAPAEQLLEEFGFTVDNVAKAVKSVL